MTPLRCVYLCGEQSPYGLAHAAAIARHFDLRAVVIADQQRWRLFRAALGTDDEVPAAPGLRERLGNVRRRVRRFRAHRRAHAELQRLGVPLIETHDVNAPQALARIQAFEPEILLSAAFPQIFKPALLKLAPRGAINFHPSRLPRCRGAHPHYWSLASGETLGGVSAHFMTPKIDDGDIVAQRSIALDGLYYDELYRQIIAESAPLVADVAEFLGDPEAVAVPQDASLVSYFRSERLADRQLLFQNSAVELWNRVRAGRSFFYHQNRLVSVERAHVWTQDSSVPMVSGSVIRCDDAGFVVAAGDGQGLIVAALRHGGRGYTGAQCWQQLHVAVGDHLE
ncbi:MAG: methionyl-tRNA formyltransferase [Pseudomonadales bacterium]